MNMDTVLIGFIFGIISVLLLFIIRVYWAINLNIKVAKKSYFNLQQQIDVAQKDRIKNQASIQLLEDYNQALITRLFIIIKDILLVQKLILGKNDK